MAGATEELKVVILVKAAPVLTSSLEETMCVAGVRVDGDHYEWVRLHPVPFSDLEDDSKFSKYQTVTVGVRRPRSDRRPESWSPIHGSIVLGDTLPTDHGWAQRRRIIEVLGEARMCDLVETNRQGSGPGVPSLAVVRPVAPPTLDISVRDAEQLKKWRHRAEAKASLLTLFDDPNEPRPPFEVVPWRFKYRYECAAPGCNGHDQTIVDWEALVLWRRIHHRPDWQELMRRRFEDDMWKKRDAVLFVGNQEQHPGAFLVLGVFWPPSGPVQGSLDL